MSIETVEQFSVNERQLQTECQKIIAKEVRQEYKPQPSWYLSPRAPWLVGFPELRYELLPAPVLWILVQPYLVAGLQVSFKGNPTPVVLIGPIGKTEKLQLPMVFLQAMLDDDLESFPIIAKDGTHTTWKIANLKETITLPDHFVAGLFRILQRKSVVSWLLGFGGPGRSLAPQVAGCLLGLQFQSKPVESLPLTGQLWSQAVVMGGLTAMFGAKQAKDRFDQGFPFLKPTMNDEEALRTILQHSQ